ncbi:MAG: Veg family protein [Clostridia bacterium]|nr:Veg family protein [Clostridia bacterium]
MIKSTVNLSQVKAAIKKLQQKPVDVTLNLGRNKFVKFSGTLTGVYPALFTVVPFDKSFKGKTTYSYSEYMCGRVRLKISEQKQMDC